MADVEGIAISVSTHSGDTDELFVDSFNSIEIADKLNDNDVHAIEIGGNIYSRIDIKNIKRLTDEAS